MSLLISLFFSLPVQSEEKIQQLSVPSAKEKEEEEICPPKESVSGTNHNFFFFFLSPPPTLFSSEYWEWAVR